MLKMTMNDYVYLWVDKYRFIDTINGKDEYVFTNFGISLTSKYQVTYENNANGSLSFDVKDSESKKLHGSASEASFYSDCISDLKVIVGKNGAGKSSIVDFLRDLISGNMWDESIRFCLLYIDESNLLRCLKKNVTIESIVYNDIQVDLENAFVDGLSKRVLFYTATFNDEWSLSYPEGFAENISNLGTRFLLQQDVENYNNNPELYANRDRFTCHTIMDSKRQINFVGNFIGENDFLSDIFNLPNKVVFRFSNGLIKNGLHSLMDLFDLTEENQKKYEKIWFDFYKSIDNLKLKIRFALIMAHFLKYKNNPSVNDQMAIGIELIPNEENLDIICSQIRDYVNFLYQESFEDVFYVLLSNHQKIHLEDTYFEFEVTQEKELIKSLLKALEDYASLTLVMEFQWNRSMSSGESCYLRLFSRLYDEILELKKFNKITDKIYAPILIDEVDLYLHPDWQCKWFYRFIKGLEIMQEKTGVELKLQLIMTTHSPFMLTDFISDNIARIAREYGHTINRSESSDSDNFMVGNIYDILKDGFFLDGTMGLFIEKKLKKILAHPTILSEQDKFVIDHIGDALIRSLILNKVGGVND